MSNEKSTVPGWLWGATSSLAFKIAAATFAIDQINKWWLLLVYRIGEKGKVTVTPFFDLILKINTGISYSLLDNANYTWQLVLALFSVVVSAGLWIWLAVASTGRMMAWAIGLIIGGALGNGLDRILIGGVADFYSLHAFGFYWYVFNIADVAIVAGVALLLYDSFVGSRNDAANRM